MKKILRLGTRGSPLALIQAEQVRSSLLKRYPDLQSTGEIELVPIRTTGDWRPEMAEHTLAEIGGTKGLFTKEIDEALLSGFIDAAVHSVKDMATVLPSALVMMAMLERADPRDAFISQDNKQLADLPAGATVGTASLRRGAQIKALRPDLNITPLRGNVETRLKKLADGLADATILAVAGIQRLGLDQRITKIIDTETMLPAAGQGAVGIVVHRNNRDIYDLIKPLNHEPTFACVTAERAFLKVLDGSCRTPIAALARMASDQVLILDGLVVRPDGTGLVRLQQSGPVQEAEKIGIDLANAIKAKLPEGFMPCASA